jgi:hypothetical protein
VNKIDIDENIIYIEDFISKEDLDLFVDQANNHSHIEDYQHPVHLILNVNSSEYALSRWLQYIEKLKEMLENDNRKIRIIYPNQIHFTKYRHSPLPFADNPNDKYLMAPHQDDASYDLEEDQKGPTFVSHGIVIFITDKFDGGEIVYVNKNISIKPKAGSLLVHPGNLDYSHAVNKFYNGERIVYAAFVHEDRV